MMSTVGLELTSFINPDLTWKTVLKGNRSGTRRTRKPSGKNMRIGMGLGDKDTRTVEDVSVSESEKLGVDVLGRRFSDKVEHFPIKKRFKFPSLSPPPPLTPSPHFETSGLNADFQHASGENSGSNSAQRRRLIKTDCLTKSSAPSIDEDFSGIEILAAAACSDSISDDVTEHEKNPLLEELTEDIVDYSASAMPLEETSASLETACCSTKDSVNEVKAEDSSFAGLREPSAYKDNTAAERSNPLPDDRLMWDLNLSIDAWPCDVGNVDSQNNIVDNLSVKSEELLKKESQDLKSDTLKRDVSSDVNMSNSMTSELENMPVRADNLNGEKQESEGCSGSVDNKPEPGVGPVVNAESSLMNTAAYIYGSVETVSMDQCSSHSSLPVSDKIIPLSEENEEASVSTHNVVLNMVGCSSEAEVGKTVCVESAQVEESGVASPCVPVLEAATVDIQKTSGAQDHDADSRLHDVKSADKDLDYPRHLENQAERVNGAEEMDIRHPSPKSEDTSISGNYVVQAMKRTDGASSAHSAQTDSVSYLGSDPPLHSRNCVVNSVVNQFSDREERRIDVDGPTSYLDKTKLDDPSNESHESTLSQDKLLTADMGNHSELQAGYDSQFEDGELRESDVQCWDEAEQVDYDTESEEDRLFGYEVESGEKQSKLESRSSSDITGEALRENSMSVKMSTVEGSDAETKKTDCLDAANMRVFSKVSKRELLSHVEGSLSSVAVKRSRSNNFNGSYPRVERESGSVKFIGRDRSTSYMRGRSPGVADHFFNPSAGYWDSRRQHSPIYHGPYNFGRSRPKSVVENRGDSVATDQAPSIAAAVARPDNRMSRQFMGSSNGVYKPPLKMRSPIERDDCYGMHSRIATVRDTNPERGRLRRYPQGFNRCSKDEYLRHIPDDGAEYFSRMPHRIGRRERSISPHGGRPHYIPYKKTRSRSRSRSPIGWISPRERNEGSRHRSRSPDARFDARMNRVRFPYAKRFAADYGDEFASPPRSRISLHRKSRMFEDRNAGLDHFRGRKSPVRMFQQGQRFDQVRPIRRMNSDVYFRPMTRPRRFPDMAAGGKGCKYEGSDDDKHGSRYEMSHRVRRYDTDGAVSRFRYNTEDAYMANNSLMVTNANGVSSRRPDDAPRTADEDGIFKMQP